MIAGRVLRRRLVIIPTLTCDRSSGCATLKWRLVFITFLPFHTLRLFVESADGRVITKTLKLQKRVRCNWSRADGAGDDPCRLLTFGCFRNFGIEWPSKTFLLGLKVAALRACRPGAVGCRVHRKVKVAQPLECRHLFIHFSVAPSYCPVVSSSESLKGVCCWLRCRRGAQHLRRRFIILFFFPTRFHPSSEKNNTDRPRVEQLRCGSRQTECCMTVWWCHRVADDFWNGARPATLGWGTVTSERGPKERNLAALLSCFLCCRCQCVVQSGLDFYSSPTEQGWAIRSTLHVFAFWWIARRPAIGSKPRLHHCAARGENCHPDMSFCPQRRQWRHHFADNSSRRREHRKKFVFLGRLSAVAIGFVPDWLSGNKRKRSEMATRRLVHGSRSGSSYMADPPPLPEEGAVTEMDAVRLAQRMNMDADVHTLLTRQHVTSHVRDHTTDTNRTARKSGMRKITTRVVRQTTTITRGEQRTFNDNVSQHYQHLSSERDTSLYEERVPVPAIEYRPVAIERSVKKVKVMREWAAIQPPDPSTSERLPFWTFFVFYFRRATSCLVTTGPCLISLMHLSLTKFLST